MTFLRSWKTTAAAIALGAVTVAFLLNRIPLGEYMATVATLAALGLAMASDAK